MTKQNTKKTKTLNISFIFQFKNASLSVSRILRSKDKIDIWFLALQQLLLALLELIGVGFSAILILSFSSNKGAQNPMGESLRQLMPSWFNLESIPKSQSILIVIFILISKNLLSLLINFKIYMSLNRKAISFAETMSRQFIKMDWIRVRKLEKETISYSFTEGINSLIIGFIGNLLLFTAEVMSIALLLVFLLLVNKAIVIFITIYFLAALLVLHRLISRKVNNLGQNLASETLSSRSSILELQSSQREVRLNDSKSFFLDRYFEHRVLSSKFYALADYYQQVPKYFLEISSLFGLLITILFVGNTANSDKMLSSALIFLIAASRLVPALLRLQSYWIGLFRNVGYANKAIDFFNQLIDNSSELKTKLKVIDTTDSRPNTLIRTAEMSFRYPDSQEDIFRDLNFTIQEREAIALVGPSGIGKSTLCDVLLGFLQPTRGYIQYSQKLIGLDGELRSGSISYLPQQSHLIAGSITENIMLSKVQTTSEMSRLQSVINKVSLGDLITNLPLGIDTKIGDGGINLSGGQKQRILLARTLIASPLLVILDEPMVGLDLDLEFGIEKYLEVLKKEMAIIVITHGSVSSPLYDSIIDLGNRGSLS